MKSKSGLIVSLVLLFVAAIACFVCGGIAIAAGGVQELKEMDLPEKLEELDLGGFETLFALCTGDVDFTEYGDDTNVSESFAAEGIKTIVIEDVPHSIKFKSGTGEIAVNYDGKWPLNVDQNDFAKLDENDSSILTIGMEGKSGLNFTTGFVNMIAGDLTVSIPDGFEGEIIVKNSVGDIDIENISANAITFTSAVGEIRGENVRISNIKLDNLVGDIDIGGYFTGFDITDCVGDIEMDTDAAISRNCEISDCMGNIDLTIGKDSKVDVKYDGNLAGLDVDIIETAGGSVIDISNCMGEVNIDND